jgi:hypothetical protein
LFAVIGGGITLTIVLVLIIGQCTGKQGDQSLRTKQQQTIAQPSSTAITPSNSSSSQNESIDTSVTSKNIKNAPDPAWKKAAKVPDLTSSGTDPTAIAASMEAKRVEKNQEQGYEGVKSPWTKSGYFTTGDKELDKSVKAFCDKYTTKGKSVSDNAYNTFCNITWSDYDEWEGNQYPHTYDWQVGYAKDFFSRGGNCFSMAAAIQWCMRYFGYADAHAELTYQERQSGGWLDHGLTWLTDSSSGDIKMIDSELSSKGWLMSPNSYNVEILDPTSNWEPRSSAFNVNRN